MAQHPQNPVVADAHGSQQRHAGWVARWHAVLAKLSVYGDVRRIEGDLLGQLASPDRPLMLAFVNAHAMNSMVGDPAFAAGLLDADWLLRDGSGMKMLMRMARSEPGLNLNGTDLIPRVIERFAGKRILLLGTREPQLAAAAQRIGNTLAPGATVEAEDGFHPADFYIGRALAFAPDLIVLGMGMPKQELVAQALRRALPQPCLIACGGAILDFLGGKVSRAPAWMRALGVEWLYRLLREPQRLFMRYVVGNPLFLWRAWRYARAQRHGA